MSLELPNLSLKIIPVVSWSIFVQSFFKFLLYNSKFSFLLSKVFPFKCLIGAFGLTSKITDWIVCLVDTVFPSTLEVIKVCTR